MILFAIMIRIINEFHSMVLLAFETLNKFLNMINNELTVFHTFTNIQQGLLCLRLSIAASELC